MGSLPLKAFSGTGKTSTLKAYAAARPTQRLLYLAFNRAIRDEAQGTFPNNVTCLTSHQLAYRAGGHHYRKKLQNQLTLPVIADCLNTQDWEFASKVRAGETAILKGYAIEDTVEVWKKQTIKGHYAVLHRTVAGVISTALNHDACYWIGGVEGYRLSDIEDIYWLSRNKTEYVKNKRNIAPYKDYGDYCRIAKESEDAEMQQTIKIIDKHEHLPADLKQLRGKAVTDEQKATVTVSTAHRSKGLEWDTVVLHDDFPNLLDNNKISLPDYYIDELNLMYVAATRAMKSLYINANLLALTVDSADKDKLKQRLADAYM